MHFYWHLDKLGDVSVPLLSRERHILIISHKTCLSLYVPGSSGKIGILFVKQEHDGNREKKQSDFNPIFK